MQTTILTSRDGTKQWEVQSRLGEAVAAMELIVEAMADGKNAKLWDQLQREDSNAKVFMLLQRILKGRMGQFCTAFIVPVGEESSDIRDLDAEWKVLRKELGFGALFKVIAAFFASPEISQFLKEMREKQVEET